MTTKRLLVAAVPLLLFGGACGDDGGGDADSDAGPVDDGDAAPPSIQGDWVITEGNLLPEAATLVASQGLQIFADGTGRAAIQDPGRTFTECVQLFVGQIGDTIAIDFAPSEFRLARIYTILSFDGDQMTMFDEQGRFVFLTRPGGDVPGFDCDVPEPIAVFDNLPEPQISNATDIEFDGTRLIYTNPANTLTAIDPASGAELTPPDVSPNAIAEQDGDLWVAIAPGSQDTMSRRQPNNTSVDDVDTSAISIEVFIQGAAVDPSTDDLLIIGTVGFPATSQHLLRINTSGEPDVLVSNTTLPLAPLLGPLAHDGTHMWTIRSVVHGALVELDDSGGVLRSVQLPYIPLVRWRGVAIRGGRTFVYGIRLAEKNGVIAEITPPAAP